MAPGSKRKAPIRKSFSSRKKGKAASRDIHDDSPATLPATDSSDAVMDAGSASASILRTVVHDTSLQAPGIQSSSGGGFFTNASHFSVNNPVMMDNPTVHIHEVSDRKSKAMELLFAHSIQGAAHDSSARDPPPRCHPDTRLKINEHIITWFYDEEKKELLIWVYGPAGVGKSAIMQTLADKLADSKHLGASTFVSRPNGRNNSRQLFVTIAYQLAVHIEDYCTFVTEKLSRDPALVTKGMEEQFKTFIVEPFVEKKIGAGGHPWAIILDGLDELNEHRSQRMILRLITDFVVQHPDVPLLWLIASRPEPHIVDTFDEENVVPAHLKKYVPANSKESCQDVERFLRASLQRIQRDFPRTVPKKWPDEEQVSQLAAAASGLFVLADTAIRFIEDPRYANPANRLSRVLSALNGLSIPDSNTQPLTHLDALYTSILSSIPSDVWPTTKRVLGALLYTQREGMKHVLKQLRAMSLLLHLDLTTVYASVNDCYSLLNLPDPKNAHWRPAAFYHASFGDYLLDSTRSGRYFISLQDVEDDLFQSSLNIWQDFQVKYPPTSGLSYDNRWIRYLSSSMSFELTYYSLQRDLVSFIHEELFTFLVEKHDMKNKEPFSSDRDKNQCFDLLSQLEDTTITDGSFTIQKSVEVLYWLFDVWEAYKGELVAKGVILDVGLKPLQFAQPGATNAQITLVQEETIFEHRSCTAKDFEDIHALIPELEIRSPQLPILACGRPGNGSLVFRYQTNATNLEENGLDVSDLQIEPPVWVYYTVPYPHPNFYHDAKHFLRDSLRAISTNYSQTIPENWPSDAQLLKLADAASYHPAFAPLAIQFIKDSHHGTPISCLDQLLTLIDGVDLDGVDPADDQSSIYVDALYTHILNSVSPDMWPIIQKILCTFFDGITRETSALQTPKGASVILGIELSAVYAALSGFSMVQMPSENAPLEKVIFPHPSFYRYLVDPARSRNFHIYAHDVRDEVWERIIDIWIKFQESSHEKPSIARWHTFCSQYHSGADASDNTPIIDFNLDLCQDTHNVPFFSMIQYSIVELKPRKIMNHICRILGQLDSSIIHMGTWVHWIRFAPWLFLVWNEYKEELTDRGLFRETRLQDLQFDYLKICEVDAHTLLCKRGTRAEMCIGSDPYFTEELEEYISGLERFQQRRPDLPVLIGGRPGNRYIVFEYEYSEVDLNEKMHRPPGGKLRVGDKGQYIFSYPDQV